MRLLSMGLTLLLFAATAQAQERSLADFDLPRDVEQRIRRVLDDTTTIRLMGPTRIEADRQIAGSVVAFDGPLVVAGRIAGELIVIGGDVEFLQGSSVTGDVTVVGGEAFGLELASTEGTFTSYAEGFEIFARGERILGVDPMRRWRDRGEDRSWGSSAFTIRTSNNYNRVEGLPIIVGPVIQSGGQFNTRLEASAIIRTGGGDLFDTDRMGYRLSVEQYLNSRALRVGGMVRSAVEPVESWTLSPLEASLATFLLHRDQRDYFEREGWGAYVRWSHRRSPVDAMVGYWDEDHGARASRDPWTLFGDGDWRAQPLVAEGRLRSLSARLQLDYRDDDETPTNGFFMTTLATHGLDSDLAIPARVGVLGDTIAAFPFNEQFNAGLVDVRIYRRINRFGTLALRGAAGGSIDGRGLPPQFQHALGGAGTLPGYGLFDADCGARGLVVTRANDGDQSFFPSYGCDRFALGSIEYRGGLDLDFGGDWDFGARGSRNWDWHVDSTPNWMVFFDAARGWALGDSRSRGARNTEILYDAGAGITLGDLGFYAAVPLNGEDRDVKFFMRLGARF